MSAAWAQWFVRAVLAGAVVAIAATHFDDHVRLDAIDLLLDRTEIAMERAGFTIARHRARWEGTRAVGQRMLEARHPACAMAVLVEPMGALNPRRDARATYFYGDASGPPPGYVAFAANAVAMAWNHALPWRDSPRPSVKMLAVTDPSACLALTATDWRWIWFGPDPRPAR